MKKVLVGLVVMLSLGAMVQAAEVTTTVDLTYTTKYMWRGFDKLDDVSAWQPSVNFDFGNGFSANVWASYAGSGGTMDDGLSRVNATEYNYTLAYSGMINEGCPWRTDYKAGWRYYDFIDTATKGTASYPALDMQELFVEFAMPDLLEGGIVPRGAVYQMWNARSSQYNVVKSGTIYVMGFGYDFTLDSAPELPMAFGWDIVFNDGVGIATDHDWSHMVWSLKTSMTCPMTGAKVTPGIYFQNSFDSSVNNEDELWASLSYSLTF